MNNKKWALHGAIGWLISGCLQSNPPAPPPELDFAFFRCEVQPVLVKQCATPACHGTGKRFFRLYARNRLRFETRPLDINKPLNEAEVLANFDAARALVDNLESPGQSMMVRKPLESAVGGYFHGATRVFQPGGPNVFASPDDPGFQKLLMWSQGTLGEPNCTDPGAGEAP